MLQQKKIPRDCGAFTLVEVALAATVLLFAIMSAFQLVVVGTRMLDFSRKQTIANEIIHSQIDALHQMSWSSVSTGTQTVAIGSNFASVSTGFTCSRAVTSVKADNTLYQVVFTVTWTTNSWTGGAAHSYSRQGTTYFGKNGLSTSYQR